MTTKDQSKKKKNTNINKKELWNIFDTEIDCSKAYSCL